MHGDSRVLGIDYGERRVGLALSDPERCIASPLEVIDRRRSDPVSRIAQVSGERQVGELVIGLPLNMDGSDGPSARAARAFAVQLGEATGLAVTLWDERMSSVSAERSLIEGGARREKRREIIDKIAAQVILQHYLDSSGPAPGPLDSEEEVDGPYG